MVSINNLGSLRFKFIFFHYLLINIIYLFIGYKMLGTYFSLNLGIQVAPNTKHHRRLTRLEFSEDFNRKSR